MTVKELIEELQQYPQDMTVLTHTIGDYGEVEGYEEPSLIESKVKHGRGKEFKKALFITSDTDFVLSTEDVHYYWDEYLL